MNVYIACLFVLFNECQQIAVTAFKSQVRYMLVYYLEIGIFIISPLYIKLSSILVFVTVVPL